MIIHGDISSQPIPILERHVAQNILKLSWDKIAAVRINFPLFLELDHRELHVFVFWLFLS